MARVTIEDSLENVENRFALAMLATKRARELRRGGKRIFPSDNKEIVHALREIAAGFVNFDDETQRRLLEALINEDLDEKDLEDVTEELE
jgi:DNA-directed RNA polymerase subunit omega